MLASELVGWCLEMSLILANHRPLLFILLLVLVDAGTLGFRRLALFLGLLRLQVAAREAAANALCSFTDFGLELLALDLLSTLGGDAFFLLIRASGALTRFSIELIFAKLLIPFKRFAGVASLAWQQADRLITRLGQT